MQKFKIKSFDLDFYAIILFVLTAIALLMRICNIDYLTLWVDEYVHVDRARFFPEQPLFTNDNNGILLTMFVIPLFKCFGVNEFWARFPSAVFGTMLVPVVYWFAKRYLNRNIALISAALVTFSTYLTFWSRICRNYAVFVFFFMLFLYFIGRALNMDNAFKENTNRLLNYLKLQAKYLWIALALLLLSILSHQLTFLFIYGLMFYYVLLFLNNLFHKKYNFTGIEAVMSYIFLLFSTVIFVPPIQDICKSVFMLFLPAGVVNWVLPNLDRLSELWNTQAYSTFDIYNSVLKTDYSSLYLLGVAGFICLCIRYGKQGFYISAMFAVPFLAMSFVFREPSLPRYLIYVYPLFLVAIACSFDTIVYLIRKNKIKINPAFAVVVSIVVIVCLPTAKTTAKMVMEKKHGQVVPHELSNWFFPDWKTSLKKVRSQIKPNDAIVSTMGCYPGFYLNRTDIIQFRQRFYNTTTHRYETFAPDTSRPNAGSLEAMQKLFDETERIWLFADYYFSNVMTDPRCHDFVVRNCEFRYDLSNEYVKIFFRDTNNLSKYPNQIVELLTSGSPGSMEYSMMLPNLTNHKIQMIIEAQGVFFDKELGVVINEQIFDVPVSAQVQEQAGRQVFAVDIPKNIRLKDGENLFRFVCNTSSKRKNLKIALYNFSLRYGPPA